MVPPPLVRRLRLTLVLLLLTLAAVGWRARVAPQSAAEAEVRREPLTIPFADVHPYGANFFLEREVEPWKLEKTVDMAQAAGLAWAKQHFPWSDIEPEPGQYRWAKYDRLVDLYRAHGLRVIARLDWPPAWVGPAAWVRPQDVGRVNAPPADPAQFAAFVAETVRHFQGRVRFYQIWNEPNLLAEWGDNPAHPVDPAEYAELLAAAAAAARAVDPDVVILSAPLAINTESTDLRGNMSDLAYLDGLYEAGAAPYFDVLSANAFGMDRPPDDPPAAERLNLRRAELQRQVMERHGDDRTAIWFNEYAWNAAPEGIASAWQRVSEAEQADWTVAGVAQGETSWPWAGVFSIWYFRQWGDRTAELADYYFRMVDVDFTPRRLYDAVRAAAAGLAEARAGAWSEWSAPVALEALDDWRWHWAEGALDGNALTARRDGARLSLRFRGNGVSARLRSGAEPAQLSVAVDGEARPRTVRVPADGGHWQWLDLATELVDGPHTLVLTARGTDRVTLDGFRVQDDGPSRWPDAPLLGLAAAVLGLLTLLVVDLRRILARLQL
jgi:hypothetical protein